ncbi:hypothetical protein [Streptomyces melanogenes]|uniref:hypothetical protein n=1 Tax=Streptomyces melanogenes TaxID=67326 RepID=UPI00167E442D|nr:hypothetical protein [Streptomyces melanogenes]GGP88091.1 hypothetical protein GCM10010278_78180 [Streptomyces melanogenes]
MATISIGGNDSRFGDTIQKCLLSRGDGNCKDKTFDSPDAQVGTREERFSGQPMETAISGILNEIVRPDITKTVLEIHKLAPYAKIVLMGYPPLISNQRSCLSVSIIGLGDLGLSAASTGWLSGSTEFVGVMS